MNTNSNNKDVQYEVLRDIECIMIIIDEVIDDFKKEYGRELNDDFRGELYVFCFYYCWKYIQKNDLIPMTAENAIFYQAASYLRLEKSNSRISRTEYPELFKERYTHYLKEFPSFLQGMKNDEGFIPKYIYKSLFTIELLMEPSNEYNSGLKFVSSFLSLINKIQYFLSISFKGSSPFIE
jgi:hypothetical protein